MYSNELADYTYKNFNVYIPYQNKKVFVKSKTESEWLLFNATNFTAISWLEKVTSERLLFNAK